MLKVSLQVMKAQMDDDALGLFDKTSQDHQNFYRFISYLILLEADSKSDSCKLTFYGLFRTGVPNSTLKLSLEAIDSILREDSKLQAVLSLKWYDNLPKFLKEDFDHDTAATHKAKPKAETLKPTPKPGKTDETVPNYYLKMKLANLYASHQSALYQPEIKQNLHHLQRKSLKKDFR